MDTQLTLVLEPPRTTIPIGVPEDVCILFERFALEIAERGFERYSADAILHRIRWHYQIDNGVREFKCNNNWTSALARWFIAQHPKLKNFFETRNRGDQ